MGNSSSKDVELEEAVSKFDDAESEMLEKLFDSLSSETHLLTKNMFKRHASAYFPEAFCERVFNRMMFDTNNKQESHKQVSKRDFLINISQILKGSLDQKAQVLLFLATSTGEVSLEDVLELCKVLVDGYTKAIEKSGSGSTYMNAGTSAKANSLAVLLVKSISKDEQQTGGIKESDVENWMRKEVLLVRLFEDVFKACFFGADSIVEMHKHGLREGCEPNVEHMQKRTDILLPCKLDFQNHNIETILDIPSMLMLNHAIPSECRHLWRLLFATSCHGKSFTTFLHRIVYQGPTILLIKDQDGAVFGGFASTSWKVNSSFGGDNDCFVFTLEPSMSIYHPTGINDHYMYLNVHMKTIPNGLGMGGQFEYFGLWLDSEFGPGHSKARPKCTTYGSPKLSGSEEFQVEDIEVWGVGVPPEQEEQQRSVLDTATDAQAILDLIGKERKSEGLREPEDSD